MWTCRDGTVVSSVNTGDPLEMDAVQSELSEPDKVRLAYVQTLLHGLPTSSSAAIIPPTELISELFTHAGAQYVRVVDVAKAMLPRSC